MGRCNAGSQTVSRSLKFQSFSRTVIEAQGQPAELLLFRFPCFDFVELVFLEIMMNRPAR
jgi:hypothetical protein